MVIEQFEKENNSTVLNKKDTIEFTIVEFMKCFNRISKGVRTIKNYLNNPKWVHIVTLTDSDFYYDAKIISNLLDKMVGKRLDVRFVSENNKTKSIFILKK